MLNLYCLQETARKHKGWTLDQVRLDSNVLSCFKEDVKAPPLEGVYVHRLVLDNATWDMNNSQITDAKQQVFHNHLLYMLLTNMTLSLVKLS